MSTAASALNRLARALRRQVRPWALVGSMLLLAAGCTSMRTLVVSANNTAAPGTDPDGLVVLRSQLRHTVAVRMLTARFSDELRSLPSLSVSVTNGGGQDLVFAAEDITISSGIEHVAILDAGELQEKLALAAVQGARQSAFPAGMKDASQSGELVAYHPDGSGPDYRLEGPVPVSGHNPTDPPIQRFGVPPPPLPSHLLREALRKQTIRPGEVGGGRVTLDTNQIASGVPLKVIVSVDGENHTFWFEVK